MSARHNDLRSCYFLPFRHRRRYIRLLRAIYRKHRNIGTFWIDDERDEQSPADNHMML